MAKATLILIANLTNDAQQKERNNKTYHFFTLAENRSKDEVIYHTAFIYNLSDERAKHLKKGALVQVIGTPSATINKNPNSNEFEINHTISADKLEILFIPKAE